MHIPIGSKLRGGRMVAKTIKQLRPAAGLTLVEVIVAMAILAIVALGALGYEYYAAQQVRLAHVQTIATHTAQLLLEDWKSTGGSDDYDPTILGLGFSSVNCNSDVRPYVLGE